MKLKLLHILLFVLVSLTACKKDAEKNGAAAASFLKIQNVDKPYLARDVLEFPDGSVILSSIMHIESYFEGPSPATPLPSLLTKFDAGGNLEWQIELPEAVQMLFHVKLLSSGNMVAVGLNSGYDPKQIGIVLISPFGEILAQNSFYNTTTFLSGLALNGVDCAELPNGNIALAMPSNQISNLPNMVRLVVYNLSLAKIVDEFYSPDAIVQRRPAAQVKIKIDENGDIIMHGKDGGYNSDTIKYFAFTLKVLGSDYSPVYHQLFGHPTKASPSEFTMANAGNIVWASTALETSDTLFWNYFNLRNQEIYYISNKATVWKTGANAAIQNGEISGYPKKGFFNKVIKCSEGGYMLLGTCNINSNQQVPSEYQIMLAKISESLQLEWMAYPNTNGPTIAADIKETKNGYLISATHLSLGEFNRPIVFKTDKKGRIN